MPITSEITIHAPIQAVFKTLTDLPSYSTWLPNSTAYKGTTSISSTPLALGTTYIETNPSGTKTGTVTEYEEPTRVAFSQPLKLKPDGVGWTVGIVVRVGLREVDGRDVNSSGRGNGDGDKEGKRTVVVRETEVEYPALLRLFRAVLDKGFVDEGRRTLEMLKKHLESLP